MAGAGHFKRSIDGLEGLVEYFVMQSEGGEPGACASLSDVFGAGMPLGLLSLLFLRRLRLLRTVESDRLANERLECRLGNFFFFADVDGAAHVSIET